MSADITGEGNMPRAGKSRRRPNRSPENRHERHEKRGRPCVENCRSAGNDRNVERKREGRGSERNESSTMHNTRRVSSLKKQIDKRARLIKGDNRRSLDYIRVHSTIYSILNVCNNTSCKRCIKIF